MKTESKVSPEASRPFTLSLGKMMTIVILIGCLIGGVTLLSRPMLRAREAARCAQCKGHLKQLALALHNYFSDYGALPPARVDDEHGRPLHSWRVLILPFLDQQSLYAQYDFNEPWDGPGNIKLLSQMPEIFSCPTRDVGAAAPTCTRYVVVGASDTMFPGAQSIRFDQVTDGLSNTLMLVEVNGRDIPWTKPEDLDLRAMSLQINDEKQQSISSRHSGGVNVAFGDGMVRFLRDSTTPSTLKSLLTRGGGESVPPELMNRSN